MQCVSSETVGRIVAAGGPSHTIASQTTLLAAEARAALVRAARMAGNPALVPELERLVTAYMAERRAGKPPTRGEVRRRLLAHAAEVEALRRALRDDPWTQGAIAEIRDLPLPELAGIDLATRLGGEARRSRVAAARIPPNDRSSADRRPDTPIWRLLWALADLWAGCGHRVGIGPDTRFFAFVSEVMSATGAAVPEKTVVDVARRWRQTLTAKPQIAAQSALNASPTQAISARW